MGITEYRQEFYLKAGLEEILQVARVWLGQNGFKVKEEVPKTYLKAEAGHRFGFSDRGTRRWLEVRLNAVPEGKLVHLHEQVIAGGVMMGNLIQEEVMELAGWLQSQLLK